MIVRSNITTSAGLAAMLAGGVMLSIATDARAATKVVRDHRGQTTKVMAAPKIGDRCPRCGGGFEQMKGTNHGKGKNPTPGAVVRDHR